MKLSIITINYNNVAGLRKTVESVFAQTYRDFEYIIVDGASTDGSVEAIKDYAIRLKVENKRLKFFQWISEPDTGIYNAMNKGIEIAEGKRVVNSFNCSEFVEEMHSKADWPEGTGVENKGIEDGYVLMLNSGDYLVDEHVIERIMQELDGTDIIQGNTISIVKGEEMVNRGYGKSDISFIDIMKGFFLHQATFFRRELFEKYGYFDESYRINGDTVLYAKCLAFGNASFRYLDQNIAYFDEFGISADPRGEWRAIRTEEDKRYMDMFTSRMQLLLRDEEKKIKLYDRLHAYKWSWGLAMMIAHLVQFINRGKE